MIQTVLKGAARCSFLKLSPNDCSDYRLMNKEILKIYELIPESYRVKFRSHRKVNGQSYIEFLCVLFVRCFWKKC